MVSTEMSLQSLKWSPTFHLILTHLECSLFSPHHISWQFLVYLQGHNLSSNLLRLILCILVRSLCVYNCIPCMFMFTHAWAPTQYTCVHWYSEETRGCLVNDFLVGFWLLAYRLIKKPKKKGILVGQEAKNNVRSNWKLILLAFFIRFWLVLSFALIGSVW